MGKNRDPYYGNAAQAFIDDKGVAKYRRQVLGVNRQNQPRSASAQLLGGG